MNKKTLFISAVAVLGLLTTAFTVNNVFAAQNGNYGYGNMGAMMNNLDDADFQKMSEAHNLMAQGRYDEARKIMQDLGISNCPMLNGSLTDAGRGNTGNGNYGGMMGGGYGKGMMGNFSR